MKRRSLDIVRHLYEEEDGGSLEELVEQNEELRDEYVALSETKALLESRSRRKPDRRTLEKVLEMGRAGIRTDRNPVVSPARFSPALRLVRLARPAGYGIAACLLLLAGYWIGLQSGQTDMQAVVAEGQPAVAPEQGGQRAALDRSVASGKASRMEATPPAAVFEWDDTEDLLMIQWRIGSLEENLSGESWDRAVPLNGTLVPEAPRARSGLTSDTSLRWIYR